MICFVCSGDTGYDGTDGAVTLETTGNYGSAVLDNDPMIRMSVCDHCLVGYRSRLKMVTKHVEKVNPTISVAWPELEPIPDNLLLYTHLRSRKESKNAT